MYKAIYRKYRPTSFGSIVGQKHVVTTLQNAIEQKKIGHAYLFHGPRGTGKTSIAKIFAEAVNCQAAAGVDKPCHQCENCLLIDSEKATDIIELDAASNNGVDEIRQIREFARYAPTQLTYKVYIIDEVHMLSTAAFNALLKTLEEPPTHVIFILATTEIHKIPQTIISRCQRFDFKKVTVPEMIACIQPILVQEQIQMEDEALNYLAEYANGGMRDALSVLDQVHAYCSGMITLKDIQDVIGTVGVDTYEQLLQDVLDGNSQDILHVLDDIVASGKNIQLFVEEFLKYLLHEIEKNLQGASRFDARILFFMLEKMNKLAAEMRTAFLPQIALQALFLEITYDSEKDETTQQILQQKQASSPAISEEKSDVAVAAQTISQSIVVEQESFHQPVETSKVEIETDNNPNPVEVSKVEIATDNNPVEVSKVEVETDNNPVEVSNAEAETNNNINIIEDLKVEVEMNNTLVEPSKVEIKLETENVEPINSEEHQDVLSLFDADNFTEEEEAQYLPQDEYMPEEIKPVQEISQPEEITTIFEEITIEKAVQQEKQVEELSEAEAEQTLQPTTKAPESAMLLESLNDEKRRLLLQRIMAEVVIYPEYNQLEKIKRKWQLIKFDPTNQITIMLLDMEPKIATKQEIVLSCYNKSLANQLQMKANKEAAEAFVSELIGQPYEIIAIDEACWTQERAKFSDKWKANQISTTLIEEIKKDVLSLEEQAKAQGYEYVTLDFAEDEVIEDPVIEEAKALFGAELVEIKE